jgi:transposase
LAAPKEKLREALRGLVTQNQRFLLRIHLQQIDALDAAVTAIDLEVQASLDPFLDAVALLTSIPRVGDLGAKVIVAEIGTDMSRFPTAGHLVSWAGLCPRNDESAGKRRSNRLRKGAPWLKTTLVQCAWAASRKKQSYLQAQFHRIRSRRGAKKALCAVAASILTAVYHMLRTGTLYEDLGPDHFERKSRETLARRLTRRLVELGYAVELKPISAVV